MKLLAIVLVALTSSVCATPSPKCGLKHVRRPADGDDFKVPIVEIDQNFQEILTNIQQSDDFEDNLNIPIDSPKDHMGLHYIDTLEEMQEMGVNTQSINPDLIEDAFLLVPELIRKHGYPAERHTVRTSDGYLLEMHRIPFSPHNTTAEGRQPVFLMHGLLDSSSTWVIMRPGNGLAYLLADMGYDVWMGNARGNRYSRNHVTFDPDGRRSDRRRFWEFSWHEIGTTDLPAMIDYVLAQTGYEKLHYIGHSQGTTSFFVMASERPAYNDKILSMQALAPVAFMSNLRSPFVRAASLFLNTLDTATSVLGIYEFLPTSELLALGGQAACRDEAWTQALCYNVLFLIAGFNSAQTNTTMIPVMLGHTPAGASANQLIHYGQGVRSRRFRQYDWGMVSNLWTYGSINPPAYNLRNIRAPVALHYSANDWLAEPVDVEELHQGLPNVIGKFLVPDPLFNHLDFVWAIDVRTLLYDRVFQIMRLVEQGVLPIR
ncbi:lipase 3-like [Bradysia coprophila]|uniref:lipase 3-like n=1 Tax=Bradysia coprophila TaxID=38358 RepID=UPI00187D7BE4|nr:lipase 3-like [Bradysia coprophila]